VRNDAAAQPAPTRILIVDDHPAVREGLAIRISREPDLAVCGQASDVAEALKIAAETDPDLVVVDISLAAGDGLELIKRLRAQKDTTRMLAWSMHEENFYADRVLRAGAMGYINKREATDTIIKAIRQVLAGKVYLSNTMADRLLQRAVGTPNQTVAGTLVESLTDRELETFTLIGRGLNTQQIAAKLFLSPKTVETYRARIMDKLNISNSTELIHRAVRWVLENV
jgi:DNA-binding NarL/FixJ family response regulator